MPEPGRRECRNPEPRRPAPAGWPAALGLDRPADVAVSTTALRWLPVPALRAMHTELGG